MEKAATDIYSFRKLRENGFTYVDKTAILLPLCDMSIGKQFFLSRPRRFGKSLLVSTLHCLFEGRRELFKCLAIEPKWDWSKSWTVIHLDRPGKGTVPSANPRRTTFRSRLSASCRGRWRRRSTWRSSLDTGAPRRRLRSSWPLTVRLTPRP